MRLQVGAEGAESQGVPELQTVSEKGEIAMMTVRFADGKYPFEYPEATIDPKTEFTYCPSCNERVIWTKLVYPPGPPEWGKP